MSRTVLVFPVLPGKDARDISRELSSRPREYEESRRRMGITMERAYLQRTPMGDFTVVYFESEGELWDQIPKLASSSDLEIDRWFVRAVRDIHGVDLTQVQQGQPPETLDYWFDTSAPRGRGMCFCAPLLPGVEEKGRAFVADAYKRPDFAESRRALKVNAEIPTINYTPEGSLLAVYIEGDDPFDGNRGFAASTKPFDLWFKEQLRDLFPDQIDFSRPIEGVEEILDSTRIADLGLQAAA